MTDTTPTSKACTKCGVVKFFVYFSKNKAAKTGLCSQCKTCMKASVEIWRKDNHEMVAAVAAASRERNRIQNRERDRTYRAKNIDKYKQKEKVNRIKFSEKIKEREQQRYKRNPGKRIAYANEWQKNNPEKVRERSRKQKDELKNYYIAKCLKLPVLQVTPELLEAKRMELTLKRGLKVLKQAQTQKGTKS